MPQAREVEAIQIDVHNVGDICNMTKHIETRKKIKSISKKSTFDSLLEDSMLNDKEKQVMRMYYLEKKDFDYIADTLGYSRAGIVKMHKRILKQLESLI